MDRKSLLALAIVAIVVWLSIEGINRAFPPQVVPVSTNEVEQASGTAESNSIAAAPASAPGQPGTEFVVRDGIPEQLLTVSNADAVYNFTSRGGGLKSVELLQYPQNVGLFRNAKNLTNVFASLNTAAAPPVLALLGDSSLQGDGDYRLTTIPGGVRAEKTLSNGLTVTKDFHIGSNYLLTASVTVSNQSSQSLAVPERKLAVGTAIPMNSQDNGQTTEMIMWYNQAKAPSVGLSYFNTNTTKFFGLVPRTPETEYASGSNDISWVSAQNQFFTLATMATNAPAQSLVVHMVELPPPSEEEIKASRRTVLNPEGLEAVLVYPGLTLKPGQSAELGFNIFAGPKKYSVLRDLSEQLGNRIDLIMGFSSWFGIISKLLLMVMIWLHDTVKLPYGWIVVLITVILRFAVWPLTRAGTRSMKRMQELQPQMKLLQEKYKDDPTKFQQKMWEFYKKNKVNPLGGCLPMLFQIPIFFGFFGMLRNAIELRGAHFLWMFDLSQPDTIFVIPGFNFPFNLMPLLMAGAQFWQASLQPMSPAMDPAQQKMMRYMPLLWVFFFYNYSAGLALYWTVSTLLTVLQTKLTKTQTPATAAATPVPARPLQRKK